MIKFFNGVPIIIDNTITKSSKEENYYVSYNPSRRDYDIDTTALVITIGDNERQVFYILKGKHTEQYEKCKNLKECVNYFMDNKELIHKMGDKFEHDYLLNTTETDFFKVKNCKRCGASLSNGRIMSKMNTDVICGCCNDEEKKHPDYKEASDKELEELKKGNRNYEGLFAGQQYPFGKQL